MEIGDNIEVEEAAADESSTRSPAARRKNGRATGKGRNGKRNGNGVGQGGGERKIRGCATR